MVDGYTVARTLRSNPGTRNIHIHCLTGLTGDTIRQQAHEAGCEQFLTKPIDFEALLKAVQEPLPPKEETVTGLTLAQAEMLLDWLQNQGATQMKTALGEDGVIVRFVCPPRREMLREANGAIRLVRA